MSEHKITVRHNLTLLPDGKWRLQVWTASTENMDPKIFVYQRTPHMPFKDTSQDIFANIAQLSDMVEYPEDEPNSDFPFFRTSSMDLIIDDSRVVGDTRSQMAVDIDDLCYSLDEVE